MGAIFGRQQQFPAMAAPPPPPPPPPPPAANPPTYADPRVQATRMAKVGSAAQASGGSAPVDQTLAPAAPAQKALLGW